MMRHFLVFAYMETLTMYVHRFIGVAWIFPKLGSYTYPRIANKHCESEDADMASSLSCKSSEQRMCCINRYLSSHTDCVGAASYHSLVTLLSSPGPRSRLRQASTLSVRPIATQVQEGPSPKIQSGDTPRLPGRQHSEVV
jgi:hypothetical protein